MRVYEIKLKIYMIKDIKNEDSLEYISKLIDKSFLKNETLSKFHKENTFKNYVFNSFFPIEPLKVYKAGNIYTVTMRTVDKLLSEHFEKVLVNEYTDDLKALAAEKRMVTRKHIGKIYSITPAVAKFEKGYWKANETLDTFEKRIKENIIKKYNKFFNTKLEEDFDFLSFIKLDNKKPISVKYKNINILGDKLTLNIADNATAQDLAYFALGVGILEMNSRGCGFMNYKWV